MSKVENLVEFLTSVKTDSTMTKATASNKLAAYFKDTSLSYLDWCISIWYKYGIITANSYTSFRSRLSNMSDEQFSFAKTKMANLGLDKVNRKLFKLEKEKQLVTIKQQIDALTPKTIPDQETLDFWNQQSALMCDKFLSLMSLTRIQQEIEALESD